MKQMKFDRQYLGVTVTAENYRAILSGPGSRDELRFHAKHLRAYLKGKDTFIHGWEWKEVKDPETDEVTLEKVRPQVHNVQQSIKVWYLNDKQENVFADLSSQAQLNKWLQKHGK
jgi:hypothetical protein